MFYHITTQRRPAPLTAHQNILLQTKKHYLNIAVGIALTCFSVQVQAANNAESYKELPVAEAAFEFENYEVPQGADESSANANTAAQNRKIVSKEFVAQQARLFFECTQVQASAARLACFDKVAEEGKTPTYTTTKQPVDLAKTFQSTLSGNPQVVFVEEKSTVAGAKTTAAGSVESKPDRKSVV